MFPMDIILCYTSKSFFATFMNRSIRKYCFGANPLQALRDRKTKRMKMLHGGEAWGLRLTWPCFLDHGLFSSRTWHSPSRQCQSRSRSLRSNETLWRPWQSWSHNHTRHSHPGSRAWITIIKCLLVKLFIMFTFHHSESDVEYISPSLY